MNANQYPPIHVLSVIRSLPSKNLSYPITPCRFEMKNGMAYKVREIRQFHVERHGKGSHFHFIIVTKHDQVFRILFDTNTFTWRLVEGARTGQG